MSYQLWRALLEDDVDDFRQYLANATFTSVAPRVTVSGPVGSASFKIGSPGALATSPRTPLKSRKSSSNTHVTPGTSKLAGPVLTRADINARDSFGRTILHHAASLRTGNSHEYVKALLKIPFIDIYAQDYENGWTALHRALYFGNIATVHALMQRDLEDVIDYTTNATHALAGGLVKIKDREGNSPFEVFGATIAPRDIQLEPSTLLDGADDNESTNSIDFNDDGTENERGRHTTKPLVDLEGDEVFAFGSNKNLTLGIGDEDDRYFPERLQFQRPQYLLQRLYEDHMLSRQASSEENITGPTSTNSNGVLPATVQNRPVTIQDVIMSKLHTAVLTNDPISNLYICGFGPGGRLGLGDESTSFSFKCVQSGGLAKRKVSAVALGQDHTIAISSQGEVFTWGGNRFGQLGYALPEVSAKEMPMQLVPRQLYGYIKKELIVGAAASSIHSAVYTTNALYTFGKNEGQLGLMDADARSLEIQVLPRRVGPSILQSSIRAVTAIDRATTVLMENHDVIVFTHYGWTKIIFQLEGFTNSFLSEALTTRYSMQSNLVQKIISGGNTICARSTFGEVFTVEVPKAPDSVPSNVSTTNPTKARNALPQPSRVWSIKKDHMSAIDVAVGQDGSIILCTAAGSVWRKEKRANIKAVRDKTGSTARTKDYKFVRVPHLTRAVAVRSNAFGAFMAVRKDTDVTREQIVVNTPSLWNDLFPLMPFHEYGDNNDEDSETPHLRFWKPATKGPCPALIKRSIIVAEDSEADIQSICQKHAPLTDSGYDLWVTSNVTDVRIPIHSFILTGRSRIIRSALVEFQKTYYYSIPDVLSIEYGEDGQIQLQLKGADFLTITNLVFYLYTDSIIDVWHLTSQFLQSAARFRSVRTELMKIALHMELRHLERAVRVMVDPIRCLTYDMDTSITSPEFFEDADVVIELANGAELMAHSAILCIRCPFFEGLFHGRARGMWMFSRRSDAGAKAEAIRVDLKHIDLPVFQMVLRHIYADTAQELFDDIVTKDLEEFVGIIVDVLSVANELMIDRLAQICQSVLGRYVNTRNICRMLNTVAECSMNEFKYAALEYICLNLEHMFEHRLLDELDPDLLVDLDETVQQNQLAFMPFARSDRAQAELFESHPGLAEQVQKAKQRRIDSMRLRSRLVEDEPRSVSLNKFRAGSYEGRASSPRQPRTPQTPTKALSSPLASPATPANDATDDFQFHMEEDELLGPAAMTQRIQPPGSDPVTAPKQRPVSDMVTGSPTGAELLSQDSSVRAMSNIGSFFEAGERAGPSSEQHRDEALNATAWQLPPKKIQATGLKDIMEQDSANRKSSALTAAISQANNASTKAGSKLSQKERKKQQQQQQQLLEGQDVSPVQLPPESPAPSKSVAASSPWQNVATHRTTSSPAHNKHQQDFPIPSTLTRSSTTPRAVTVETQRPSLYPPKKGMSSPSPVATPSAKPIAPQVQSIRHTPLPVRSLSVGDAHSSMADILAQQLIEKTAIKEAAAKRSLQEIQQEQEFQEWWESESKKVQEEEARETTGSSRREKTNRGRGSGRRKDSGRGGATKAGESRETVDESQTQEPSEKTQKRGNRGSKQQSGSMNRGRARTGGVGGGGSRARG